MQKALSLIYKIKIKLAKNNIYKKSKYKRTKSVYKSIIASTFTLHLLGGAREPVTTRIILLSVA